MLTAASEGVIACAQAVTSGEDFDFIHGCQAAAGLCALRSAPCWLPVGGSSGGPLIWLGAICGGSRAVAPVLREARAAIVTGALLGVSAGRGAAERRGGGAAERSWSLLAYS